MIGWKCSKMLSVYLWVVGLQVVFTLFFLFNIFSFLNNKYLLTLIPKNSSFFLEFLLTNIIQVFLKKQISICYFYSN